MAVFAGRYAAAIEGPFVVFLIGTRLNRLQALPRWLPVLRAMGTMLGTLYKQPEKGFLGGQSFLYWPGIMMVQYWRSTEDLARFSHDPADPHLPAWRAFNKAVGGDGSIGIWHETYQVAAGGYEAIYGNMPRFGLANVAEHLPAVDARARTQNQRLYNKSS